MGFLLGVAAGALGMWAYRSGRLDSVMGRSPEQVQQAFNAASDRVRQVADNPQVRDVVSAVTERVGAGTGESQIVTPSASELTGRPSEPLPREAP